MSEEKNYSQSSPEKKKSKNFSKDSQKGNQKEHKSDKVVEGEKPKFQNNENTIPKTKNKKENKPEYQSQIDKLLKTKKKEYDEQFLKFLEFIRQDSLDNLNSAVDYMAELYSGEEKNKKKINAILTNSHFISFITNLKNKTTEVYVILKKIDDNFDVKEYADITLNINTIFYGSKTTDEERNTKINPPLNSKSIYRLIEIILQNDKELASRWISEVFNFDRNKLKNKKFEDVVNSDSEDFQKILLSNPVAHKIFIDMIFSKKPFQSLVEVKNEQKKLKDEIAGLKQSKKHQENELSTKEDRLKELVNEINSKNIEIDKLTMLNKQLNIECETEKNNFVKLKNRYESIALRLQDELNQLKIDSANKEKEAKDFINNLEEKIENLTKELEAIKADYALKSHKLSEIQSEKASAGTEARAITMRNLVQKISSQFYYLSMFCQEIKETNHLSEDSAPFFIETINQIESAFALMGAKKVGKLDEIVKFDSSIHEPMGGSLASGDSAKITEPGWQIDNEIFIKTKVERVEEN